MKKCIYILAVILFCASCSPAELPYPAGIDVKVGKSVPIFPRGDYDDLSYQSQNEYICTVSDDGVVTGEHPGTTYVNIYRKTSVPAKVITVTVLHTAGE